MKLKLLQLVKTVSKIAIYGILIQCMTFSLLLATEINAQKSQSIREVYVDFNFGNASLTLVEVFNSIESKTDYKFAYDKRDINKKLKLNLPVGQKTVAEVLMQVSETSGLKFKQINGVINIDRIKNNENEKIIQIVIDDIDISGKVLDETGQGLPGASIVIKGTTKGTTTDFEGNYKLSIAEASNIVVSYVGYLDQEITIGTSNTYDFRLELDASQLEEIVVTALGVQRERKSLGFSVQEVKGTALTQAREPNIVNALAGKIAGVQIVKGSNGPAGSSKIVLRGYGSLTGDNQPLIVVDGVPLDNFTGADNNGFWGPSPDFGNGLADINSEDIESMSVLKGASAAALYGSRAGNGVILITTKTGKNQKGLGISYSLTTGIQSIFMKPELQSTFGQGNDGIYNGNDDSPGTASWGPKIEGQTVQDFQGNNTQLQAFDNVGNFYDNGFSQNHNISFQQQLGDGSSLYTSANYFKDESNIPGALLKRINLMTRAVSKFGVDDKWTFDAKVQYMKSTADNRPIGGQGANNSYFTLASFPSSLDIRTFAAGSDEFGNQLWFDENTTQVNPYWAEKNMLSQDSRDRFLLNGAIKHEITDWLTAEVRMGADLYTTSTESKLFAGSPAGETGRFGLGKNTFVEKNFSTLLVASRDNVFGKLGGSISLGGNLMSTESSRLSSNSGALEVPNLFSLNNGINPASVSQGFSTKKINSTYGVVQLNYDGFLFLDVTGRNDWTSSLSKENRSFFYPSVSTSFVFSDLIEIGLGELPTWFNFSKLRASYAEVGNDLSPFQLVNAYSIGSNALGNTTATTGNTLFNPNVVNELIKSLEFGFEGHFFKNRLKLDVTWYKTNSTNQLISIPLDPLSGYNSKIINAGDIQNKGIEIAATANILKSQDKGLTWDLNVNYTKNENTINELEEGVTQFGLGGFDNFNIFAEVGGRYGVIEGTKYRRVEDETSSHFGKIIVDGDGVPLGTNDKFVLGSQVPDALIGVTNSMGYKNISLSFLISGSIGGEIFSGTNRNLQRSGLAAVTVVNGAREDIVFDGVVDDGSENYTVNTVAVSPQVLWTGITSRTGNLGITEANVYDATNIRLRNVSLNYRFPSRIIAKTPFQGLQVGVSMNNVWMISSNLKGVDPESVFATGSNAIGFENLSSPTTRTVFFNIAVNF